jgi:cyanophycinase-like exopeptidase
MIDAAGVVYFTGGDQLKLASELGGSPMVNRIHQLYEERGGVIAGTSAGASAMGATMLVSHATKPVIKWRAASLWREDLVLYPTWSLTSISRSVRV